MSERWKEEQLGNIAQLSMGQSPAPGSFDDNERGMPFLQGCAEFGSRHPRTGVYCHAPLKIARASSTLISVRAPVGKTNRADRDYCIGRGLAAILAREGSINNDFLQYAVEQNTAFLHRRSQGSTFLAISSGDLRQMKVSNPPKIIQNRIAEILLEVDNAIDHTEAQIVKYEQIKTGLMHDLFTRGLDESGHLRPTCEEAPELYERSPLGLVPIGWSATDLGHACEWSSGGTPSKQRSDWWSGDFPWLTPKDMKSFALDDTSEHLTEAAARLGSHIVPSGSVFIVVRGMILAHTFPVVFSSRPFAFNQDIKAVRGRDGLDNRFLAYWFCANDQILLRKVTEATHGTKRFDLKDLYSMGIAIPPGPEQQEICRRLDTLGSRIEQDRAFAEKLKEMKQGLMQDLLTGEVPVNLNCPVCEPANV